MAFWEFFLKCMWMRTKHDSSPQLAWCCLFEFELEKSRFFFLIKYIIITPRKISLYYFLKILLPFAPMTDLNIIIFVAKHHMSSVLLFLFSRLSLLSNYKFIIRVAHEGYMSITWLYFANNRNFYPLNFYLIFVTTKKMTFWNL